MTLAAPAGDACYVGLELGDFLRADRQIRVEGFYRPALVLVIGEVPASISHQAAEVRRREPLCELGQLGFVEGLVLLGKTGGVVPDDVHPGLRIGKLR